MLRVFIFLLSFGMTVAGFTYMIMYLNLFSQGYDMSDYLSFIIKRSECLIGFIGLIITSLIIFMEGDNNGLHI